MEYRISTESIVTLTAKGRVLERTITKHSAKRLFQYFQLFFSIRELRRTAAIAIQAWHRGLLVRKEVSPVLSHTIVCWPYPATQVSVSGTFSSPHWAEQIPLTHSKCLGLFYADFVAARGLAEGLYFIKFIVDGDWLCNERMPIFRDYSGIRNNLLEVAGRSTKVNSKDRTPKHLPTVSPSLEKENFYCVERDVKLVLSGCMAAKPRNKDNPHSEEGSADAFFIDEHTQTFGLADGVGEWRTFGLDPSKFPKQLMEKCHFLLRNPQGKIEPADRLEHGLLAAHSQVTYYGSSTALLALCANSLLYTLNLGDSSLLVLSKRPNRKLLFRCAEQSHSFNCPYQLSMLPKPRDYEMLMKKGLDTFVSLLKKSKRKMNDCVFDADSSIITLKPGYMVIAGTDGVFDNLHESEIIRTIEYYERCKELNKELADSIAKGIVNAAVSNGWNPTLKSPFAKKAAKAGRRFIGGKLDDTTVIVGIALP